MLRHSSFSGQTAGTFKSPGKLPAYRGAAYLRHPALLLTAIGCVPWWQVPWQDLTACNDSLSASSRLPIQEIRSMEIKTTSKREEISQRWTTKERLMRKQLAAAKQLQLRQLVFLAAISEARSEGTCEHELQVSNAC
jgi:hypothetical protein